MNAFKFRLARVLELREQQTETCRERLVGALQAVREALARLQNVTDDCESLSTAWREAVIGGMSSGSAATFQAYLHRLVQDREAAQKELEECRKKEAAARADLDRARDKQRRLERLRDKALARFVQEASRREQAQLDEFAVLTFKAEAS